MWAILKAFRNQHLCLHQILVHLFLSNPRYFPAMQKNQKQYGLVKMSKGGAGLAAPLTKKPSIFDDSEGSSSDEASVPQFQTSTTARKQAKEKINKAIEEDPSIFQYDEVYEEMKTSTEAKSSAKKGPVERKSRYINTMLKNRDNREKEQELRAERKIQKEREAEGDEFQDKEAFVTSAYKEKLEQMRKAQQDIDRQENMDNILDVTKQGDLNGFYRSLYRNNLFNTEQTANATDKPEEAEPVKFNKKSTTQKNLRDRNLNTEEQDDDDDDNAETVIIRKPELEKQPESAPIELPQPPEQQLQTASNDNLKRPSEEENPKSEKLPDKEKETGTDVSPQETLKEEAEVVKKPKIDRMELIRQMFTKRTVGQAFEDARQRYLERKAQRAQVA